MIFNINTVGKYLGNFPLGPRVTEINITFMNIFYLGTHVQLFAHHFNNLCGEAGQCPAEAAGLITVQMFA